MLCGYINLVSHTLQVHLNVISLGNISKVFSHFYYTLMVYVYHTCYLILVPFCFYKSYQRVIRQHLYVFIKYIPIKNTTTYFKYIPMKTQ